MPRFSTLAPEYARVGRHQQDPSIRIRQLAPYISQLEENDAGMIELDTDDDPAAVKAALRDAAKITGIDIRSSWTSDQTALVWKKVGRAHRTQRGAA